MAEKVDLARTVGRGTLLVLRLDPDPRVLASVLENRFTVEADVLQAASRPGATEANLSLIAGHPRWGLRPGVRGAVLRHPNLPVPLALSLLTRASLEDLKGVRESPRSSALLQGLRGKSPCGEGRRGLGSKILNPWRRRRHGRDTEPHVRRRTPPGEAHSGGLARGNLRRHEDLGTPADGAREERSREASRSGLHARIHPLLLAAPGSGSGRDGQRVPGGPRAGEVPRGRLRRRAGSGRASCAAGAPRPGPSSSAWPRPCCCSG